MKFPVILLSVFLNFSHTFAFAADARPLLCDALKAGGRAPEFQVEITNLGEPVGNIIESRQLKEVKFIGLANDPVFQVSFLVRHHFTRCMTRVLLDAEIPNFAKIKMKQIVVKTCAFDANAATLTLEAAGFEPEEFKMECRAL